MFLGQENKHSSVYLDAIQPIAAAKKMMKNKNKTKIDGHYLPHSKKHTERMEVALEKRQAMVNTYKDRLLPRFNVWQTQIIIISIIL